MLHIVNHFPVDPSTLNHTRFGDTILFTDNAVLAIKKDKTGQNVLSKALTHLNSYVCKRDLLNRGVSCNDILNKVCIIDDQDLQNIAEDCTVIRSCN